MDTLRRCIPSIILLVFAGLAMGAWVVAVSQPGFGYELVYAYGVVTGTPSSVQGDGVSLAVMIASRPLAWLFLGAAVTLLAAPPRRAAVPLGIAAAIVLAVILTLVFLAPQPVGITLLGLGSALPVGGLAFVLPGMLAGLAGGALRNGGSRA